MSKAATCNEGGPVRAKGAFCKYFSSFNYSPFYENNCSQNTLFIFVKRCNFNFEKAIVVLSFAEGLNSPICSDTLLLSNVKLKNEITKSDVDSDLAMFFWGVWNGDLAR